MKSATLAANKIGFNVPKLERETLHDSAYFELKKAIMSGAIRPGATITIRAMAAALGISPMPVREALRRLVAEQALVMLPTRSVSVPLMTSGQFDEICWIRVNLEGRVTEAAAKLISPEELRSMHQAHAVMSQLKRQDTAKYLAKNKEFHFLLYRAARMPVALKIIESLWLQVGPHLNLALSEFGFRAGQDHHRELLEALTRRNVKAARGAIESDIADAAGIIREFLDSRIDAVAG